MLGFRFRFLVFLGFVAQAMGLELMWPNSPAAQSNVSVQFFGGVTPYDMTISNNATKTVIYTYLGNDNVTYWEVNVDAGTVVVFKVVDATGLSVTSTPITVTQSVAQVSSISVQSLSSFSVSLLSQASVASISSISTESLVSVTATTNSPSSTITSPPGSGSGTSKTGSKTATSSGSPSQSPSTGGGHSNAGAIAGGVVGGIIGVGIAAVVAIWWFRRRRDYAEANAPSSAYFTAGDAARYRDHPNENETMLTGHSPHSGGSANFPEHQQYQQYPMTPTSFPGSEAPMAQYTTTSVHTGSSAPHPYYQSPQNQLQPHQFSGLPEV